MRTKDAVGRRGEELAGEYLAAAGLEIVERNWRCRDGELDIVAREGSTLVFVEVKARSSVAFGTPAAAVDRHKAARIRRLAVQWMDQHRQHAEGAFWAAVRFDVVSVLGSGPGTTVEHLAGSF